jgi:hypothetical protein
LIDVLREYMVLIKLEDFADPAAASQWRPIDDLVMGGVSRSSLTITQSGIARCSGSVSLERGGGFASTRTAARTWATPQTAAFADYS